MLVHAKIFSAPGGPARADAMRESVSSMFSLGSGTPVTASTRCPTYCKAVQISHPPLMPEMNEAAFALRGTLCLHGGDMTGTDH